MRPLPPITTIFILRLLHFTFPNCRLGPKAITCGHERAWPRIQARASGPRQPTNSTLDEGEKVGIDRAGVSCAHAMRELLVNLQGTLLEEFRGEQRGISDRDDLVVVAMHNERWYVDDFQILGKIGLRKSPDAIV